MVFKVFLGGGGRVENEHKYLFLLWDNHSLYSAIEIWNKTNKQQKRKFNSKTKNEGQRELFTGLRVLVRVQTD